MEAAVTASLPSPSFWLGKRVFLTGHTGFKGAWLTLWLRRLGAEVTGYALAPAEPSLFQAAAVERQVRSIRGDILDHNGLQTAMRDAAPDIVLHLAAQALVRQSYREPMETLATNVLGTAQVLQAAGQSPGVRAVVIVTTDKCYENREWPWPYRETDALGGYDMYSASKACAEIVSAAWRRSFPRDGLALATARAGNVIGGGDWSVDRLVPDCVRAFWAGQPVVVRNPVATRPWQHVLEPLCGYLLLAERLHADGQDAARAFNFGPAMDDVQPVAKVVEGLADAWGDGARWRVDAGTGPHEAGLLAVDPALARVTLGWRPRLRLPAALQWTGRWYRQFARGADAARLVDEDIANYESIGTAS